jgi:hypothetical protein
LVVEENRWKVNSCDEQDQRSEVLDDDEISWVTKKLAGKGCSGWKMARVLLTVARGDGGRLSDQ